MTGHIDTSSNQIALKFSQRPHQMEMSLPAFRRGVDLLREADELMDAQYVRHAKNQTGKLSQKGQLNPLYL